MEKNSDIDFSSLDTKEKILDNIALLKGELQNLKLKLFSGNNDSGLHIRKIRRNIARLFTKLNSLK